MGVAKSGVPATTTALEPPATILAPAPDPKGPANQPDEASSYKLGKAAAPIDRSPAKIGSEEGRGPPQQSWESRSRPARPAALGDSSARRRQ
jgi:hypothetical protein